MSKNKNDNAIYYTCHAILDTHLWFQGEDGIGDLFRLQDVKKRLISALPKLIKGEYLTAKLWSLILEIERWEQDDNAGLEAVDTAIADALDFYMSP